MNKKTKLLSLLLILPLVGCGNEAISSSFTSRSEAISEVSSSSSEVEISSEVEEVSSEEVDEFIDYVESDQTGKEVFARGHVGQGYIGDPMPYYHNNKMHIFYLEDARNYRGAFHPISLLDTEDFMHYQEYDRVIPFENNRQANDFALGTGSCIQAKDGLYHFFYTGHNSNSDSGLPYVEKIQHATSSDLINWTKLDDGFYGTTNDFRDPHVIYIEELDEYWLLITQFKNTIGTIEKYVSKDLYSWTNEGTFYRNTKGYYNMECCTLIKYKGYWYLAFSEQGDHRVVHYRYKKDLQDPNWIVPEVDYLDDEGFYAGKIAGDEERLFLYGWCGTKGRSQDTGTLGWGGNLVGHELYQKENGELGVKPITEVREAVSNKYPQKTLISQEIVKELVVQDAGYHQLAFEPLKANRYTRFSFDYTPQSRSGQAGIMFNIADENSAGTIGFNFDSVNNLICYHNNIKDIDQFNDPEYTIPFNLTNNKEVHIDVYYQDKVTSVYVNDEVVLTARTYAVENKAFSLFAKDKRCSFKNINFYE